MLIRFIVLTAVSLAAQAQDRGPSYRASMGWLISHVRETGVIRYTYQDQQSSGRAEVRVRLAQAGSCRLRYVEAGKSNYVRTTQFGPCSGRDQGATTLTIPLANVDASTVALTTTVHQGLFCVGFQTESGVQSILEQTNGFGLMCTPYGVAERFSSREREYTNTGSICFGDADHARLAVEELRNLVTICNQ